MHRLYFLHVGVVVQGLIELELLHILLVLDFHVLGDVGDVVLLLCLGGRLRVALALVRF